MSLEDLIRLCKWYSAIGENIQERLDAIIAGTMDVSDCDSYVLGGMASFLDAAIEHDMDEDVHELWNKVTDAINVK
jgi:hypothetical protein